MKGLRVAAAAGGVAAMAWLLSKRGNCGSLLLESN
jgi:hypothetical protein